MNEKILLLEDILKLKCNLKKNKIIHYYEHIWFLNIYCYPFVIIKSTN